MDILEFPINGKKQKILILNRVSISFRSLARDEVYVCYTLGFLFSMVKTSEINNNFGPGFETVHWTQGLDISHVSIPEFDEILKNEKANENKET